MDSIPRYDTLGIYDKSLFIRQSLAKDEELFYSCNVEKYNRYGFLQDRILMITSQNVITLTFGPFNYNIHRKISLKRLEGYTRSSYKGNTELVLHFVGDYDERYKCGKHMRNIEKILIRLLTIFNINFKYFRCPDRKLKKYVTVKNDVDKGKFKRPDPKHEIELPKELEEAQVRYDLDVGTNARPSMFVNESFKSSDKVDVALAEVAITDGNDVVDDFDNG